MTNFAKLTSWLIAAWLVLTLTASALHLYVNNPNDPPLPLGLAAITPLALFLVWFAVSKSFRQFTMSLNPRVLTWVQTWRIGGYVFLVLAAYRILPDSFALPAGLGDMTIGATAVFAGLKLAFPEHRKSFIAWQLLGMADLVAAIALGTLSRLIDPSGISTGPMTVLPMSFIPTFVVPLCLMLHVICIAQATQWSAIPRTAIGQALQSPSA
jgi:hypothetical protein